MTGKKRLLSLVAVLVSTVVCVVGIALKLLYDTAFEQQRARLVETVQSRASLMEAVARYDIEDHRRHHTRRFESQPNLSELRDTALAATLSQIRSAHENFAGFGETGEFTLAKLEGDQIVFVLRHRHFDLDKPKPVPFNSDFAEPTRRALQGQSGTVVGLDYRGVTVLAAYKPVAILGLGVVAKIDLSEIRAPFARAGIIAGGIAFILIVVGVMLVLRIGNPMVEELAESEEKYLFLIENMNDGMMVLDSHAKITFVNHRLCQMVRYAVEQLVGRSAKILLDKHNRKVFREQFAARLRGGDRPYEIVLTTREGDQIDALVSPKPMVDDSGRIVGSVAVVTDISERKKAKAELDRQLELQQVFLDALPPVAMLLRRNTREIVACNKAGLKFGGQPGRTCYETWGQSDRPCAYCLVTEMWKTGQAQRSRLEEHGKIFDAHWIPVSDDLYLHYVYDITDQHEAQEALRESEEKHRTLFETMAQGVVHQDADGQISSANPAAERILGLSIDQMRGRTSFDPCWKAIHEDGTAWPGKEHPPMIALRTGEKVMGEVMGVYHPQDERYAWIRICATPLFRPGESNPYQVHTIFEDITDRRRAEQALAEQAHDLQERVKELNYLYRLSLLTGDPDLGRAQVFQGAVELIPPAWQYPDITAARIVVGGKKFTTTNHNQTDWTLTAPIQTYGVKVGSVEIVCLEEQPVADEGPFLREERTLIDGIARALGQYLERQQTENRLRDANVRLIEGQLALEDKNTALKEVLDHVSREQRDLGLRIQAGIDRVIDPMLIRMEAQVNDAQKNSLTILRSSLKELTSPFINKLEHDLTHLAPREIEICNMIKNGLSSKEVGQILHTSEATVRSQRKRIRKKLGLSGGKTNLATYLQQV